MNQVLNPVIGNLNLYSYRTFTFISLPSRKGKLVVNSANNIYCIDCLLTLEIGHHIKSPGNFC